MTATQDSPLSARYTRDEIARRSFISSLRGYVLDDLAGLMRERYQRQLAPAAERAQGAAPADGRQVHELLRNDPLFRSYSSLRYNLQEMVFRSVIPAVDRDLEKLSAGGRELLESNAEVSLELDPEFEVPRSVSAIDVHLAPGGYHSEFTEDDVAAGAIYDNGIKTFAYGQMGQDLDDIGSSMANWVRLRYPDFHPKAILDGGCTIGHNTLPWARTFPGARVYGIDVSAPLLRYAAARAATRGVPVTFKQMSVAKLDFPDESFDVVFSSMLLHELPMRDIHAWFREARRVLRPGGLLLNMELPPNSSLEPYDQFYLDWDCYYNNEPYYKPFRDKDYRALCTEAGFPAEGFVEITVPRYTYMEESEFRREIEGGPVFDAETGRFSSGIRWYGFGSWK
ncbi:MAG: methyltransferase domain-containing protein [Chromatiales bacterium]|nr:methyltransferase domain-containing protein [Chromatiales bacterium]